MSADRTLTGPAWEFPARLDHVVDGDTIDVITDLGFRITRRVRLRVAMVDTAETFGVRHDSAEYQRGTVHKAFTREWLAAAETGDDWPLHVTTLKDAGKYGRWIADVQRLCDGDYLTAALHREFDDV